MSPENKKKGESIDLSLHLVLESNLKFFSGKDLFRTDELAKFGLIWSSGFRGDD
jgi:hypothetical protein